jgi:hypothetical protein
MTESKKDCLLKPKLSVLLAGKSEEEIPIDGDSVLSGLHDIAKWVVTTTAVDHEQTKEDHES